MKPSQLAARGGSGGLPDQVAQLSLVEDGDAERLSLCELRTGFLARNNIGCLLAYRAGDLASRRLNHLCGFIPGETVAPVQTDDHEENIERYLNEYLNILKQADVREAVAARIFALADAERLELSALREQCRAFLEG